MVRNDLTGFNRAVRTIDVNGVQFRVQEPDAETAYGFIAEWAGILNLPSEVAEKAFRNGLVAACWVEDDGTLVFAEDTDDEIDELLDSAPWSIVNAVYNTAFDMLTGSNNTASEV